MMTWHTQPVAWAALTCLAFSVQLSSGQTPGGDFVQDGQYGYTNSAPWQGNMPQSAVGAAAMHVDAGGAGVPIEGQYGGTAADGVYRLPTVPVAGVSPAGNSLLADIPCGYPSVVTEMSAGNAWAGGYGAAGQGAFGNGAYGGGSPLALPGPSSRPGLFFSYDALYGTLSAPSLGPVGSAAAEGIFFTNGITNPFYNSFSTDVINSQPEFGHRIEFGCINECGGFLASYFSFFQDKGQDLNGGQIQFDDPWGTLRGFADGNGDMIDDDINGNRVHGRNGEDLGVANPLFNPPLNTEQFTLGPDGTPLYDGMPDTAVGTDLGDLVTFVPVFDTLSVRNTTNIDGFELMYARPRKNCNPCRQGLMMLYGVRAMDIDEDFSLRGTGSFFDETNIRTQIDNLIIGPSIGFNLCRRRGPWRFEGVLKSTLGLNFRRANQYGELASNSGDSTETHNVPVNLNPSAFSNVDEDEEFAPIIEWRAGLSYCCSDWLSARIGYTGMFIDGVTRAAGATSYTLPNFGLNLNGGESLNFNALTFGLEFYR